MSEQIEKPGKHRAKGGRGAKKVAGDKVVTAGISFDPEVLAALDAWAAREGYKTRARAVDALLRAVLLPSPPPPKTE